MLTFKAYATALDEGKVANFAGRAATTAGGSYAGGKAGSYVGGKIGGHLARSMSPTRYIMTKEFDPAYKAGKAVGSTLGGYVGNAVGGLAGDKLAKKVIHHKKKHMKKEDINMSTESFGVGGVSMMSPYGPNHKPGEETPTPRKSKDMVILSPQAKAAMAAQQRAATSSPQAMAKRIGKR